VKPCIFSEIFLCLLYCGGVILTIHRKGIFLNHFKNYPLYRNTTDMSNFYTHFENISKLCVLFHIINQLILLNFLLSKLKTDFFKIWKETVISLVSVNIGNS
jgi:hypothetical protein